MKAEIHLIPTDKPSRLFYNVGGALLFKNYENNNGVNIYITNSEEIKEGWYFNNSIGVNKPVYIKNEDVKGLINLYSINPNHLQKIILTTDTDLIKDGVQAIDDEFLEWFVKNSSCEEIEVEQEKSIGYAGDRQRTFYGGYKIIIPKEEPKQEIPQLGTQEFNDLASACFGGKPKQECCKDISDFELGTTCPKCNKPFRSIVNKPKQETFEEFAERIAKAFDIDNYKPIMELIIDGAKWQQERMYSEEEVIYLLYSLKNYLGFGEEVKEQEWFEQYKKK